MNLRLKGDKKLTPYTALNKDYFMQPRDVCIVDEINLLNNGDAEVLVFPPCIKERSWIYKIASTIDARVTQDENQDDYGRIRFVVSLS